MLAARICRIVAFAWFIACPISSLSDMIVPRQYHGKQVICRIKSSIGSLPKEWGVTRYSRVFKGTVKSATNVEDFEKRVELVPEEVFVGDATEATAITNQACLGTEIQAGQKWLIYLFRSQKSNELVLGYEGRSKPIGKAQKDIEILRNLSKTPDSGILIGHVGQSGHKVVARRLSDGKEFSALADTSGNYELELPAGKYFATANTTQGLWAPETEILVSAQDCTQLDFWFRIDGRIAGSVETADGKAASYVQVAIIPISPAGESFTVIADGQGHFEVGGRQPGKYLVGVGILAPVYSAEWQSRVDYPGVPTREQAHVIDLGKGEWRTDISFMLASNSKNP